MSQAFTFGFNSDIDDDDDIDSSLEESHMNLSAVRTESQLEEPRLHSLHEMV